MNGYFKGRRELTFEDRFNFKRRIVFSREREGLFMSEVVECSTEKMKTE